VEVRRTKSFGEGPDAVSLFKLGAWGAGRDVRAGSSSYRRIATKYFWSGNNLGLLVTAEFSDSNSNIENRRLIFDEA
jgi:hypothetical protein